MSTDGGSLHLYTAAQHRLQGISNRDKVQQQMRARAPVMIEVVQDDELIKTHSRQATSKQETRLALEHTLGLVKLLLRIERS